MQRALPDVWNRRVARLPAEGVLLVATDLQGNLADYERLKDLYAAEDAAGNQPILAFVGDLVHGPSPELNEPDAWPSYLGTAYADGSAALVRDFDRFTRTACAFSLLGNHEHAHIGGPVVPKFYEDEAAVLDAALGDARREVHRFFRTFPLVAVAPCGLVLTHGAPAATCATPDDFERLDYAGYEHVGIHRMYAHDVLGALLWARSATDAQARALLQTFFGRPQGLVAFGHDVVHEGYEKAGDHQICVSTSYGLFDRDKVYLRLDLAARYRGVGDLREGVEIRRLYGG